MQLVYTGRVVPRSMQPRRCQAAKETRGPQSGRVHTGGSKAPDEVNGSRPRECRAFTFAFRGGWKFYFNPKVWRGDLSLFGRSRSSLALISQKRRTVCIASPQARALFYPPHTREVTLQALREWLVLVSRVTRG
jgi:hypothetical protein